MFKKLYGLKHASNANDDDVRRAVVLRQTPAAQRACWDYMNAHNVEGMSHTGHMASAWSKLEAYAARLPLIVHLARWACGDPDADPDCVDLQSVEAGIALTEWFCHEMQRVYAMLAEDKIDTDQRRLVERIKKLNAGGKLPTARNIMQACKRFKRADDVHRAWGDLIERGYGSIVDVPPGPKGGRSTQYFKLLPGTNREEPW
jgi:uncharacterized protein DUF3987